MIYAHARRQETHGLLRRSGYLLRLGVLIGMLLSFTACAGGGQDETASSVPADVADPPELIGGDDALYDVLQYPEIAQAARVQGPVIVRVVVGPEGVTEDVDVIQGIHEVLDSEARRAVQEMTFRPGRDNGIAVRAQIQIPVRFELDEQNKPVYGNAKPVESPETTRGPVERPPKMIGGLMALQESVRYPREAKKQKIDGKVWVQCVVSEEGVPTGVHVVESIHPLLDIESVRAVREIRFEPAMNDGKNVPVQMTLPVTFRLK